MLYLLYVGVTPQIVRSIHAFLESIQYVETWYAVFNKYNKSYAYAMKNCKQKFFGPFPFSDRRYCTKFCPFVVYFGLYRTWNSDRFGTGSFRPVSFRSTIWVGRFCLGRWVVSAHFLGGSFRP